MALLCALARDPLLRSTAKSVLDLPVGAGSGADRIVGAIRFRSAPRRCGLCCHDMTPGHGGIRLQGDWNCELAFVNFLR